MVININVSTLIRRMLGYLFTANITLLIHRVFIPAFGDHLFADITLMIHGAFIPAFRKHFLTDITLMICRIFILTFGKYFLTDITLMIRGIVILTFGKHFLTDIALMIRGVFILTKRIAAPVTEMIIVRINMSESRNVAYYHFCRRILANTHHDYYARFFAGRF